MELMVSIVSTALVAIVGLIAMAILVVHVSNRNSNVFEVHEECGADSYEREQYKPTRLFQCETCGHKAELCDCRDCTEDPECDKCGMAMNAVEQTA